MTAGSWSGCPLPEGEQGMKNISMSEVRTFAAAVAREIERLGEKATIDERGDPDNCVTVWIPSDEPGYYDARQAFEPGASGNDELDPSEVAAGMVERARAERR